MAQFYTKERSVTGASPKIYDDSQRILTEAENIIESMRAVSSIEEQQNATLINNLRAHRQREKELNTRNHQMLMDNMQQVAEAQQRKDKIALDNKNLKRQNTNFTTFILSHKHNISVICSDTFRWKILIWFSIAQLSSCEFPADFGLSSHQ